MNKILAFKNSGFEDYLYWQTQDRKTLKRINLLIREIERCGHDGIGNLELLKHNLQGWWSRRIDDEHRLVYRVEGNEIQIMSCRFHYGE